MLIVIPIFASLEEITSFEADFIQNITDEKNKTLNYRGHLIASRPQNAKWSYQEPVKKDVYINNFDITIVEPEIEQVIIRRIESDFDFFKIISNAKRTHGNEYVANYKNSEFTIIKSGSLIKSISYLDKFENKVTITFKNQKQNQVIDEAVFRPSFPLEFDIIRD